MSGPPAHPGLYRHPTRSEIIEQAVAEGHDADIPTSVGSLRQISSNVSTPHAASKSPHPTAATTDLEKGAISSDEDGEIEEINEEEEDPDVVFWDGPNDPENPMNWPANKRWGTVAVVSGLTFLTPLASSNFAPGVPEVMKDFHSTSDLLSGFMVSVYVLGFAFGPMIIAPLSEIYGRLPLYHTCTVIFLIFTVAAGVSTNMTMFIVFRFIMGSFGAAPMVLGGGTIADLISREQRGTAMSVWMMGPTIGPCVGPIIGGFLTQAKGWRWNFYFVAIVGGAFLIGAIIFMKETSAPVILERKAKRLRAETGNPKLRSKLASDLSTNDLFKFSIARPLKMLFLSPICFAISVYIAITYAYLYILFTTFTRVFSTQYHWTGGIIGLSFLGLGIGSLTGQIVFTHFGNRLTQKHMERGDFVPEHRLYIMTPGAILLPIGFFIYGWGVQYHVHWIVPLIGTWFVGFGLMLIFMPSTTYLVDVFTIHAASAMAASTVLRSLCAAFIPLSSEKMYAAMGYGWGNSLLGFVGFACAPIPFLFIKYGDRIRGKSTLIL
ncbi:MFS general substrate transporter [Massarina eburnea CBS 473.64]|uniref:MFS general substrate transporter n=1 Tax=Massarina eburnea CBS 473.64 TaxID=1395130 RepID=A0A6A6S396_9PLEO|nr:MFS general substrate transporter [Massarina eburnea CBS 473.64]